MKTMLSAMDFYLGVELYEGHLVRILDIKAALREEITMLKDMLTDWANDYSQRTVTYRSPVRLADGSWKLIKKTEVMNKQQVKNLIANLETILEHNL